MNRKADDEGETYERKHSERNFVTRHKHDQRQQLRRISSCYRVKVIAAFTNECILFSEGCIRVKKYQQQIDKEIA